MIKDFRIDEDRAWNDLPIIQAIAYRSYQNETNPLLERLGPAYIGQHSLK